MRTNLVHSGAEELSYEIREIVEFGMQVKALGVDIIWENIGDPVAKGEKIPAWIKELIAKALTDDKTFAYSPTKGLLETRQFLSNYRKEAGDGALDPDYQWAMVGEPGRDYLWILSREPSMDRALFEQLKAKAEGMGYDLFKVTEQPKAWPEFASASRTKNYLNCPRKVCLRQELHFYEEGKSW